ncbi:MAG: FtsX-like permease family protein [Polyangiales bacterium]
MIGRIEVRMRDPDEARDLSDRIERLTGYDAESWQETNQNFLSLFSMQNRIVAMQIGAILTVGGFGILAIQIMIVLQKTRDIAILRSVGLRRKDILLTFLVQGIVVALAGAVIGDLAGWRLLVFMGALKIKQEGLVRSDHFLIYEDPWFYPFRGLLFRSRWASRRASSPRCAARASSPSTCSAVRRAERWTRPRARRPCSRAGRSRARSATWSSRPFSTT